MKIEEEKIKKEKNKNLFQNVVLKELVLKIQKEHYSKNMKNWLKKYNEKKNQEKKSTRILYMTNFNKWISYYTDKNAIKNIFQDHVLKELLTKFQNIELFKELVDKFHQHIRNSEKKMFIKIQQRKVLKELISTRSMSLTKNFDILVYHENNRMKQKKELLDELVYKYQEKKYKTKQKKALLKHLVTKFQKKSLLKELIYKYELNEQIQHEWIKI